MQGSLDKEYKDQRIGQRIQTQKNTQISLMVDKILKDSGEVYGSDDEDLSGDEIKTPIFVITNTQAENAANRDNCGLNEEMDNEEMNENQENELIENEEQVFVQEEYDLA